MIVLAESWFLERAFVGDIGEHFAHSLFGSLADILLSQYDSFTWKMVLKGHLLVTLSNTQHITC